MSNMRKYKMIASEKVWRKYKMKYYRIMHIIQPDPVYYIWLLTEVFEHL